MGEISESFEYGLNAAATEYDGKHKYIRITDIDDSTHLFIQDNLTSPDIDFSTADDYLLQAGDVLFARTGASVGKTYIYRSSDGDLYFAGFLIRAKIKRDYDADFVFQNTLTDNYDSYIRITSQRSGQPGVNAQEYANFALSVPCLAEQKKIGAYFTNLDNLITLHQRECFSFDFSGESAKTAQKTISWEQRELSDLIEENQKPVPKPDGEYIRLGIRSHAKGTFHEVVAEGEGLDVDTMYVVESNNLIVNITFAWEEAWAITTEKDAEKLVSHRFPQYRFHHGQYPMFYQYRFRNGRMKYNLELASPGGAGRNRVLNKTEFMKIPVIIPISYEEEKKIGDLFANLDNLITLHQHKPNKKGHDVLSVMPFKGNQRKPHYLCT